MKGAVTEASVHLACVITWLATGSFAMLAAIRRAAILKHKLYQPKQFKEGCPGRRRSYSQDKAANHKGLHQRNSHPVTRRRA